MGAPIGNKNASGTRDRAFSDAVRRAVLANDGAKLRQLAEKLIDAALAGDIQALRELADRIEGKAAQQVQISGDADAPLKLIHESR